MIDQALIDRLQFQINWNNEGYAPTKFTNNDIQSLVNNYISLIEQNAELHKQSEKYKAQIKSLIHCDDVNTGYEPSLSVFQREIDLSKKLVDYGEE